MVMLKASYNMYAQLENGTSPLVESYVEYVEVPTDLKSPQAQEAILRLAYLKEEGLNIEHYEGHKPKNRILYKAHDGLGYSKCVWRFLEAFEGVPEGCDS